MRKNKPTECVWASLNSYGKLIYIFRIIILFDMALIHITHFLKNGAIKHRLYSVHWRARVTYCCQKTSVKWILFDIGPLKYWRHQHYPLTNPHYLVDALILNLLPSNQKVYLQQQCGWCSTVSEPNHVSMQTSKSQDSEVNKHANWRIVGIDLFTMLLLYFTFKY